MRLRRRAVTVAMGMLIIAVLGGGPPPAAQAYTASAPTLPPFELHCGQGWRGNDGNFDFGIWFQCLPMRGVLNWDVRFASPLRERAQSPVAREGS